LNFLKNQNDKNLIKSKSKLINYVKNKTKHIMNINSKKIKCLKKLLVAHLFL